MQVFKRHFLSYAIRKKNLSHSLLNLLHFHNRREQLKGKDKLCDGRKKNINIYYISDSSIWARQTFSLNLDAATFEADKIIVSVYRWRSL